MYGRTFHVYCTEFIQPVFTVDTGCSRLFFIIARTSLQANLIRAPNYMSKEVEKGFEILILWKRIKTDDSPTGKQWDSIAISTEICIREQKKNIVQFYIPTSITNRWQRPLAVQKTMLKYSKLTRKVWWYPLDLHYFPMNPPIICQFTSSISHLTEMYDWKFCGRLATEG